MMMIANSFDDFVNKASDAIRTALNTEMGQEYSKQLLAAALKANPNMTQEEWHQIKCGFMTRLFVMFVQETPEAMQELGTHVYNELNAMA